MIHGIGVDIVQLSRIDDAMQRHGDKFAQKILADVEYQDYISNGKQLNFLAKRFAAKEACAKALGTGFRAGMSLKHIAITNNDLGKPELSFSHVAQQRVEEFKIHRSHISLSDERDYVVAFVTLEFQASN